MQHKDYYGTVKIEKPTKPVFDLSHFKKRKLTIWEKIRLLFQKRQYVQDYYTHLELTYKILDGKIYILEESSGRFSQRLIRMKVNFLTILFNNTFTTGGKDE